MLTQKKVGDLTKLSAHGMGLRHADPALKMTVQRLATWIDG